MAEAAQTLPELLQSRANDSSALIGYLDVDGRVVKSVSYPDLLSEATRTSRRLLASGLRPDADVIISSFSSHEDHIRIFWACCIARIRICPIPPVHPDPSRQALFFNHLQQLFHQPTLIAHSQTITEIKAVAPDIKAISLNEIDAFEFHDVTQAPMPIACQYNPEDVVCLMLTSGSTGNSKAVALSHSNLLSSVRGKVKHHNTTSSSRFLNWIAFDHVACVSEIHLHALQVNASQYHTAPSAIIRRPRNLLDWCSKYQITYSFSPNFLLAQICREVATAPYPVGSLDLSSMRAFISGGEAVPVKTAVEFSNIIESHGAPRDSLRAGFGMSETGAGCIYDVRPIVHEHESSPTKYLSLGNACDGTSMRVIAPSTGLPCPAGETGQLQVSGRTVFHEYYRNAAATAESFTSDGWFITGDSAQLDQDGNLHIMGRDKDLININGIKHPSVDVEHFIEDAEIEGVMRSFVYVCPLRLPNSDTESYAVFYQHVIHVENELRPEDLVAISQANRSVSNACVVFCSRAPHVVLPLPRKFFSKTALGKVSRTTLLTAYLQGMHSDLEEKLQPISVPSSGPRTVEESAIKDVVMDVISMTFDLSASELELSQTLFDIGASSMHLIRLKHTLQERLNIPDIPTIEMLRRPEIGQLCIYLNELKGTSISTTDRKSSSYNPLVCLNPRGSKPPLFLVHPGVGEVLVFIQLAQILKDDRPVYALRARGFDTGEVTFGSFQEMVEVYSSAIEGCYPTGPYFIAGYSFGGAVAFEIGKNLEARGKYVAWVGILNLPPHIQFRMNELTWVEVLVNIFMFLSLISPSAFNAVKRGLYESFSSISMSDTEPDCAATQIISWLFERSDQSRLKNLHLSCEDLCRWTHVAYDMSCLGRTYQPSGAVQEALTTVFCAIPLPAMGNREEYKQTRLSEWKNFSGNRLEFVDVDGEHYTMLADDHVDHFAAKLRDCLERATRPLSPRLDLDVNSNSATSNRQLVFNEVPTIDFSLVDSDPAAYFEQLRFALEDVGFGVFINVPGFEDKFQEEIFDLARQLFQQPQERKDALGTGNSYALRGYFRADNIPGPHKAHAEAYRFGLDLPEPCLENKDDVPFWLRLHEGPNQWPAESDLPRFREKMERLFSLYHSLNVTLNSHICRLLDIPRAALEDYFPEKPEFNSAIWHYLPVTPEIRAEAQNNFAQGMHEHRDPSTFLTCLIQSRPGLQVQNHEGDWIDVPMVKGGVVCNIGMQLMKLTGGKLVATTHRVNTLKIEEDRYTVPYVLSTKLDKPVVSLPQYSRSSVAKDHVPPNAKILKLMAIEDPLVRSGYARLSLFPAATQKLYPREFEQARRLGIV